MYGLLPIPQIWSSCGMILMGGGGLVEKRVQCHFVHHIPLVGANPVLCGYKPATNRLSYSYRTALRRGYSFIF
jgi:hypothetical protein